MFSGCFSLCPFQICPWDPFKNMLRTVLVVRNFPLSVAMNFLEHSFGAFIEKVSPFMPALQLQQTFFTSIKKCFWNLFNLHHIKHYIKNVLGIYFLM